nr:pyridoxal-phosphate dependent enzyme [Streptomyces sp. CB02460]
MTPLSHGDVKAAADRVRGHVRPVTVTELDAAAVRTARREPLGDRPDEPCRVWLALEFMQHTGSFKACGAWNFLEAHREEGTLPAARHDRLRRERRMACAWAPQQHDVSAVVFLPSTAPEVKVARLRSYGAEVRLVGTEYADALAACEAHAAETGALASHAYDHPLSAASAGTLLEESLTSTPWWSRSAAAACSPASRPPPSTTESAPWPSSPRTAGPSRQRGPSATSSTSRWTRWLRTLSAPAALQDNVLSVLVPDDGIVHARKALWGHRRLAVEHGAATALAALLAEDRRAPGTDLLPTAERAVIPEAATGQSLGRRCASCCVERTLTRPTWSEP